MTTTLPDDTSRLRAAVDFVTEQDTETLLPLLLPGLVGPELRSLAARCRFAHAALLVFPPDPQTLHTALADCGLTTHTPPQPSVVVRERLALRHRRTAADLDVNILRPVVIGRDGRNRTVEVFTLTVPPQSGLDAIAAHERRQQHEAHVAFEVLGPDPLVLHGLCSVFARFGAVPDGGGYNPYENSTVFYYTAPPESKADYRRVELYVPGDHRDVLAAHLGVHRAQHPAERSLRLLTRAWTSQALAAFEQLRVPEVVDTEQRRGTEELAQEIDADTS